MRKPSNFTNYPFNSVFKNCESEVVAKNIMVILKNTGNKWRKLNWKEYKEYREKEGDFSNLEKNYFEKVVPYCTSPKNASLFSHNWTLKEQTYGVVKREIDNFFFTIKEEYQKFEKGYKPHGFNINKGYADEITLSNGRKLYTGVGSLDSTKAKELGLPIKTVSYEGCCIYANINKRAKDKNYFPIKIN